MVEAQRVYHDKIPFGIRALESGVEVAGVWISRSNTPYGSPASSALASPPSSVLDEPNFGQPFSIDDSTSHKETPPLTRTAVRATWSGTRLPTMRFNRDRSTGRALSTASIAHSQNSQVSSRSRPKSLPTTSLLRYSMTMDSMDSTSITNRSSHRSKLVWLTLT
jgi:hypothetical protein